jgi:hypothetical protein
MHVAPDAVSHERPDHRETVCLDVVLDRERDVTEVVAHAACVHSVEQGLPGDLQQAGGDRRDRPDRQGDRGIRDPALVHDAHVDRQDVAAGQLVGAGNPVHDHRVRAGADRAREASIALERRLRTLGADELLRDLVQLRGRDPGARLLLQQPVTPREDVARGSNAVDLLRCLLDDQSVSSSFSVARVARMCPFTSSGDRVPSNRRNSPRLSYQSIKGVVCSW